MGFFNVKEEARLTLVDILMRLPLNVDWYLKFETIESAHNYLSQLTEDDYPDNRLFRLVSCLTNISNKNSFIFEQISYQINKNAVQIIQEAFRYPIEEKTKIGDSYITNTIYPVGRKLFASISNLVNRTLKKYLESEGFTFAKIGTSPEINRIVDRWNKQIKPNASMLPKFAEETATSVQSLKITCGPIDRKRPISKTTYDEIQSKIYKHLDAKKDDLIIARYYHVSYI